MVAWEVLTQSMPFAGMNPMIVGMAILTEKLRPPLPEHCPASFGEMLTACWHDDPEQRLTFTRIQGQLQAQAMLGDA